MGQKEAARYRPTRLDPRADVVLIGMGRIAVDAPALRLHRHVMPRYAYPPRPVDDRAPQRARRLKADQQYGRFSSDERRVGKEGGSTCSTRCSEETEKKK